MTEQPKRPWFRFHLTTALLTMLTFGGLLGIETLFRERINGWLEVVMLSVVKADAVVADEMAFLPPCLLFNTLVAGIVGIVSELAIRRRSHGNGS